MTTPTPIPATTPAVLLGRITLGVTAPAEPETIAEVPAISMADLTTDPETGAVDADVTLEDGSTFHVCVTPLPAEPAPAPTPAV